ncbi:hypothetical protein BV25DRAFT_1809444 [Artomyces pyxidatus]|uniref:Uncharacterized protein n=1 Tax=Artomyces pyxidatus TaxID=48021 RepID=A0ACB8SU34_9AGAM|nr:hypothetical protein BV25DRAFT_1809444 [Artomyces pyxidatus]
MLTDDLPWPELGNVSRGATRGNQGQKGVLTGPDSEGRCLLQLRVQPGVLTVLLNRQASDWYRHLDAQVNHALKLTKTYWRKARRRQDYDPVADQDHMELHEWLQQLKDKVMSHLELLMQRGDIKGPPYVMPDNLELTFLRKFIERQAAGIPHNPRLRKAFLENRYTAPVRPNLDDAETPEPSEDSVLGGGSDDGWEEEPKHLPRGQQPPDLRTHSELTHSHSPVAPPRYPPNPSPIAVIPYTPQSKSPRLAAMSTLEEEVESSKVVLQNARNSLRRAQKATQESFAVYTASIEAERRAWQEVATAEDRRDNLVSMVLRQTQTQRPSSDSYARKFSYASDSEVPRYSPYEHSLHTARPRTTEHVPPMRSAYTWGEDAQSRSASPRTSSESASASDRSPPGRKHPRVWDNEDHAAPRKRSHHGSHTGSPALQPQQVVSGAANAMPNGGANGSAH